MAKANEVIKAVADDFVAMLEDNSTPDAWRKPWRALSNAIQSVDRRPYRGSNQFILGLTCMAKGLDPSQPWGTYKAWSRRGAQVRKGEKSTAVILWKFDNHQNPDTGVEEKRCFMTCYSVFHASQVDGFDFEAWDKRVGPVEHVDPFDDAAELLVEWDNAGCPITYGGDVAAYSPALHVIRLPVKGAFESVEAFYSTALHEVIHSTARACKRDLKGTFGSEEYAFEELIAETGSAMLCGVLGVHDVGHVQQAQHKAYVAGWVKAIKKNPKALVMACQRAQKAVDQVLKTCGRVEDVPEDAREAA